MKEILKAKGVRRGKRIPQNGQKKDFIILLLFFFLLVIKNLVELVIWQCMLGLKTFNFLCQAS